MVAPLPLGRLLFFPVAFGSFLDFLRMRGDLFRVKEYRVCSEKGRSVMVAFRELFDFPIAEEPEAITRRFSDNILHILR